MLQCWTWISMPNFGTWCDLCEREIRDDNGGHADWCPDSDHDYPDQEEPCVNLQV